MKKHLQIFSAAALTAITMTSCLSSTDTSEQTFSYPYSNCFNVVTNDNDGSVYINRNNPSYNFVYHTGMSIEGYVDITISNLQLAANLNPISLQLPSLSFSNPEYFTLESKAELISPINQGSSSVYLFDNFKCQNIIGPNVGVYNLNYRLTNSYSATSYTVRSYATNYVYRGDVTFSNEQGDTSVSEASYNTGIAVALNSEAMTASIVFEGMSVSDGRNESFGIAALPLTLTPNGYSIATEPGQKLQLMNSAINAEKAGWNISDITFDATLSTGASISFTLYNEETGTLTASAPTLSYFFLPKE